jgi:hypothetical protein
LVGGGDDGGFAKNPLGEMLGWWWVLLGHFGPFWAAAREREGDTDRWAEPREREERVLSLSLFFLIFISLFKFLFSNLFEFCLKLNFAREVNSTHGFVK